MGGGRVGTTGPESGKGVVPGRSNVFCGAVCEARRLDLVPDHRHVHRGRGRCQIEHHLVFIIQQPFLVTCPSPPPRSG